MTDNKKLLEEGLKALAFRISESAGDINVPIETFIERYKELKELIKGE